MEPLPKGANFHRAKILWELGLDVAGDPSIPYGGNRDMMIVVGSGGGETFRPSLRLATGSAIIAKSVARGDIDMAFVNPSAMLTQAYRGVGLFSEKLPVRIVGNYPSWDRFVMAIRKSLGFRSLADVVKAKHPLKLSIREDPTHSTLVLIAEILEYYGTTLAEIESWGGKFQYVGGPYSQVRLDGMRDGSLDAVFDEGLRVWLPVALESGFVPLEMEPEAFAHITALGWRRVPLPRSVYPQLDRDYDVIDFSGWPLYTRASLPDEVVYDVCQAWAAREPEMAKEEGTYTGIMQVFHETEATPMDVPMHPGALRWYEEHATAVRT